MFFTMLCAVLHGVLEGITEWLPISSTGHLILLAGVFPLPLSAGAAALFEVTVQIGAILAVSVLYRQRLLPLGRACRAERRRAMVLWGRVMLATLPSAAVGLLLDDRIEASLHTPLVVALALVGFGILFLFVGKERKTGALTAQAEALSVGKAFLVGVFQLLALVPGTSRSGATILGGLLLGLTATAAAEFSFFLGIPTMLGAGLLRGVKFFAAGGTLSAIELVVLVLGAVTAFLVSMAVIRFLLDFVRRHSFVPFGIYRILLGAAVLALCFYKGF